MYALTGHQGKQNILLVHGNWCKLLNFVTWKCSRVWKPDLLVKLRNFWSSIFSPTCSKGWHKGINAKISHCFSSPHSTGLALLYGTPFYILTSKTKTSAFEHQQTTPETSGLNSELLKFSASFIWQTGAPLLHMFLPNWVYIGETLHMTTSHAITKRMQLIFIVHSHHVQVVLCTHQGWGQVPEYGLVLKYTF